jgi:diguanylate cyclase (GGDEF)-like protein
MREGIAAREAQITDLACQDSLTRLPNRVLFSDRMQQALKIAAREDKPLSVMIMDLDRFKDVNDALGHHVGDLLLLEVATRFKAALKRDCDTVARLGGDEFAILLPGADSRGAQHVARDLLSALDRPVFLEGHQISVGSSIGIASYPAHGDDMNNLLRHADMAMYAAKRDNKGLAVYDVGFGESSRQRLSLMAELRQAVENDELVLHYQPKIDLRAATVNHVEALVRWIHPERGFITPDQFIPFAEHTGYITTITRWVAEKATRQCVAWRAKGMPIHISMNISARDLLDPELPVFFAQLLAKHHALPEWFSLEVTESAVMGDPGRSQNGLHALRDMGLQLSIDDFGTGYSSLAYLKKLPAEELKIDRSFVMAMTDDKDDAAIVRSTIELGHNMGLKVVAEGVECKATWDMLLALGCDFAQGYFMSRPLAPTDLEKWLAESGWKLALRRTAAPRKLTAVLANHGS